MDTLVNIHWLTHGSSIKGLLEYYAFIGSIEGQDIWTKLNFPSPNQTTMIIKLTFFAIANQWI